MSRWEKQALLNRREGPCQITWTLFALTDIRAITQLRGIGAGDVCRNGERTRCNLTLDGRGFLNRVLRDSAARGAITYALVRQIELRDVVGILPLLSQIDNGKDGC